MRFDAGTASSFTGKRHPYYVFAADFRDTSAGVTALHYLCHALNCAGEAAYVLNTQLSKPGLNVRFLAESDCRHHRVSKVVPIMVYPEIVSNNPYRALAVVRYMLNRDGFLTGNKIEKGERDLTFYHSPEFVPEGLESPDMMQIPVLDDELFSPPKAPVLRNQNYLLLSRIRREDVDFSQLPPDIEILDINNPKSLKELAAIFQTASVLYSYELSGTCVCAMLAGCPVIYIRNHSLPNMPGHADYSTDGAAFIDEPGGLDRARATVAGVRKHWQKIKDDFPSQLDNFIRQTQALAESINQTNDYAAAYIMYRIFPNANASA